MAAGTQAPRDLGRDAILAIQAVGDAVRLARSVEEDAAAGALTKADASPVTIADFGVQALVSARLARECPGAALVAEEDASALREARQADLRARVIEYVRRVDPGIQADGVLQWIDRGGGTPGGSFWTLDPIDGTKGLLRGGQYVVALALIVDGNVQLGVLGCPRLSLGDREGGIAVAARGRGAWWTSSVDGGFRRLTVSTAADPRRARVLHSFEAPHSDAARLDRVLRRLGAEEPPVLMDSQAKHVVVASGRADLLLRFPMRKGIHDTIWDQAAGSVLIQEAGGQVTDLEGRALDFSTGRRLQHNDGVVASNSRLHEPVLDAIRRAAGPSAGVSAGE